MPHIELNINKAIFNDVYYPYLTDYSRRYNIYYGGAGSGKSYFITQKLLIKALTHKRKILVMRKVMATQKDSCWQLFLDTLSQFKILPYVTINKSNYTLKFPNGSIVLFKGLDDKEKIKSIAGITDIWAEEATEFTEEDIQQLDLRLRQNVKNLQFYFSFNPVSKANYTYKKWFADGVIIDDETFVLQTTYKQNKFLPQQYIDTIEDLQQSNLNFYKVYALGEFASLDKLVFNNWKIQPFDYTTIEGDLLVGLDWGFVNDTTALIASIMDESTNTIYIFDEWGAKGKTNDEIAKAIENRGYSKSVIVADSAEQKSIEEVRRLGIAKLKPSEKGKGSILAGIQKLQAYNIVIHPNCVATVEEFQNYSWTKDKKTDEYTNKPIDEFNHYIDALRYSLQCKKGKLRTLAKDSL